MMELNGQFIKYRKTSVIEVVGKNETGMIVQNVGNPSDQWTIPFETFEATYLPDTRVVNPQIENNFSYHPPKEGQPEKYDKIRKAFKELAYIIDETCPPSRDRSVAMTELETANFWANASIARN